MKKRSLVAAIAMLLVSAVVLTSSTYAWFAASNSASVTGISATTGNTSGSIYISANGNDWYTSLVATNFSSETGNSFPAALSPCSFNLAADSLSIFNGTMSQNTTTKKMDFVSTAGATGSYIKFTVHVYAEAPCTVTVTPTLTATAAYIYGATNVAGSYKTFGANGSAYYPITTAGNATDDNTLNGIIDEAENASMVRDTQVTVGNAASQTVTLTFSAAPGTGEYGVGKTNKATIEVYVWAEGQDEACFGNVASETVGLALNFAKA